MKRTIICITLFLILLTVLISGCTPSCPKLGDKAPDFTLESTDGKSLSLKDFDGKKVVLNIWATWCGPCRAEIPLIQKLYEKSDPKELQILAIDVQESSATVRNFAANMKITYPILIDQTAYVAQTYCLPSVLPVTLFIDKRGFLRVGKAGAFQNLAEIEDILNSLK